MKTSRRKAIAGLTALAGTAVLNGEQANVKVKPQASSREVVAGIGGFFFRAHDPEMLAGWYRNHLGIDITPKSYADTIWKQEAGATAFTPFPEKTGYFGDPSKQWSINFRVHNLDRLTSQLEAEGIPVKRDPETYPNGRFARIHDPEGNPIELWEPRTPKKRE